MKVPCRTVRLLVILILLWAAQSTTWVEAAPLLQDGAARTLRITLLPDFEKGIIRVEGIISLSPGALGPPDLGGLGLQGLDILPAENRPTDWLIWGELTGGRVDPPKGNLYHAHIGPLHLAEQDKLSLYFPFMNLRWEDIDPPPDNLSTRNPDLPIPEPLRYNGKDHPDLQLDLPFTPIRQSVDLVITPLVSEAHAGSSQLFRLSGKVTFADIAQYADFERYCDPSPAGFDYRASHLLFRLDHLPSLSPGNLDQVYQFKPTRILLRTSVTGCTYQADKKQVSATFNGRADSNASSLFPEKLAALDVKEQHAQITLPGRQGNEFEIRLGEVVLGPGDQLQVRVPDADVITIRPAPDQYLEDSDGLKQAEYLGPRRFELVVRYTPRAALNFRQIPLTLRGLATPLEKILTPVSSPAPTWPAWLLIPLIVELIEFRKTRRFLPWLRFAAWLVAAAALFFGLRGLMGWLVLAALLFLRVVFPERKGLVTGIILALAAGGAIGLDQASEQVFSVMGRLDPGQTLLTPAVYAGFGLVVLVVVALGLRPFRWKPAYALPLAVLFFTFSAYDAFQKSLPALGVAGLWVVFFVLRCRRLPQEETWGSEVWKRFSGVFRFGWYWLGFAALVLFASYQGLTDTLSVAVFKPEVGLAGPLLIPLLTLLSVALAFLASTGLFVLLYPLLPFREGVFKAVVLALALLSIFLAGTGSDSRLVGLLDKLLVSRFIYYLCAPLLAGLILDVRRMAETGPAGGQPAGAKPDYTGTFKKLFGNFEQLLGMVGGIASLAAPAVYAAVANNPLVTTYFQLMKVLLAG